MIAHARDITRVHGEPTLDLIDAAREIKDMKPAQAAAHAVPLIIDAVREIEGLNVRDLCMCLVAFRNALMGKSVPAFAVERSKGTERDMEARQVSKPRYARGEAESFVLQAFDRLCPEAGSRVRFREVYAAAGVADMVARAALQRKRQVRFETVRQEGVGVGNPRRVWVIRLAAAALLFAVPASFAQPANVQATHESVILRAPSGCVCVAGVESEGWVEILGDASQPDPGGDTYVFAAGSGIAIGGACVVNVAMINPVIGTASSVLVWAGPGDFDCDGDLGTDADIARFFSCLSDPSCRSADFDLDGSPATDQDIECFFRVLGGGEC